MRSVLHALIWDSFRYAGWTQLGLLACCLFPLGIYGLLGSMATGPGDSGLQPGDPVMLLLEVSLLPFILFTIILGVGAGYAKMSLLYTKPLSNLSIAAWRMIGGTILLAIQVGLMVLLYNQTFNAGWPLAGAVLFSIAAWFAAQPFFCLAGKSILSTLVTMIPIGMMCAWFLMRYKPPGGKPRDWNDISLSETSQLLAVIVVFAWATVHSVALARRGDGLPWLQHVGLWFTKLFNWQLPVRVQQRPFRSPQAAMFWYEWRWKGWALSACMLLLLAVMLPAQLYSSFVLINVPFTLQSYYEAVCAAYLGTTFPAMILGVVNGFQLEGLQLSLVSGRTTRLNEIDELGSFQATRPVTDAQLSRSNLWVCLASVSLTTAIWLVFVTPVLFIAASQGQLAELFAQHPFFVVPLVAVFMWVGMSNITSLTSTGRTALVGGGVIALGLTYAALLSALEWVGNKSLEQVVLRSLAVSVTLVLTALAVWAFTRSMQLGFVTRRTAFLLFGVALAISFIGYWLLPETNLFAVLGVLCTAILCVLPWATTPLATRWNRHR